MNSQASVGTTTNSSTPNSATRNSSLSDSSISDSPIPNSSTPKPLPQPNRYHRGTGHWRTPQQSRSAKR
ncbi:hypothetical protein HC752_18380 [Vibrio sp. S9_S30]|uniref:hypothetical protein n=1 Tax=Vibrio sp. S9_S30 TaxID=2720226 RepID=UPI001681975F|nr:hypothetical protein [Vibrio sp. S9_S30]MBD1558905.1 hypothetical protein [Vibrio sp. S9_S30]